MTILDHFAEKSVRPKAAASSRLKLLSATAACAITMICAHAVAAPSETILYNFKATKGKNWDVLGNWPRSGLTAGPDGSFYGTAFEGGSDDAGTVFQLFPPSKGSGQYSIKILKNFNVVDNKLPEGGNPLGTLITDSAGNLYGVTHVGGSIGYGVAYRLSPPAGNGSAWTYTVLHNFGGSGDGQLPQDGLIMDSKGNLYGTTLFGGNLQSCHGDGEGCGIAYELSPPPAGHNGAWTETILYKFQGGHDDGAYPAGALAERNGVLYGTTAQGGLNGEHTQIICEALLGNNDFTCGTVFSLSKNSDGWVETILHKFSGNNGDGVQPASALYVDNAGNLFGTTLGGGTSSNCVDGGGNIIGCGAVFELSPPVTTTTTTQVNTSAWPEKILHSFDFYDGWAPNNLTANAKGQLFGTTLNGGQYGNCGDGGEQEGCGVVFELSPSGRQWSETTLHAFTGANHDGGQPIGNLLLGSNGVLYGTTSYSDSTYDPCFVPILGAYWGCGTVFEVKP
jgi:uncharacterized repeat protein (TIGR03803 family)